MTVTEMSQKCGFKALSVPDGEREVRGVYCCDLLSWVMGRAKADDAWITIMTNVNIVAVASLADTACILLAEDVVPDENVLQLALDKGVNILSSPLSSYGIAAALANLSL